MEFFQIDLLKVMPDTFLLMAIACNYAERRHYGNVDFDYRVDHLQVYYGGCENFDSDDGDTVDNEIAFIQAHVLNSSICYTDLMLGPLCFTRFCSVYQQIFLL